MENIYYKNGSFKNFKGEEQKFVVSVIVSDAERDLYDDAANLYQSDRRIGIGVAICNASDKFDEKIGQLRASGRARKFDDDVCITFSPAFRALINDESIQAVLDAEVAYVAEHPGVFIGGYDQMKASYEAKQKLQKAIEAMDPEERAFIEKAQAGKLSDAFKKLVSVN